MNISTHVLPLRLLPLLLCGCLCACPLLQAQNEVLVDSFGLVSSAQIVRPAATYTYPPDAIINRSNSLAIPAAFTWPEEVLHALRVATTPAAEQALYEDANWFRDKGRAHYQALGSAADDDLAFRLLFRYDFTEGGAVYSTIKYRIEEYETGLGFIAVQRFKKTERGWVINSTPVLSQGELVLLQYETEFLRRYFTADDPAEVLAGLPLRVDCPGAGGGSPSLACLVDLFYQAQANGTDPTRLPFINQLTQTL